MGECAWHYIPLLDFFLFQNRDEHDCTADHNHRCNRDYDPHKAAALRRNIVRHRGRENRLYLQYKRYRIFIKGCSKEDYDDFFRATGYIDQPQDSGAITSVFPVCDSDRCCKTYMDVPTTMLRWKTFLGR